MIQPFVRATNQRKSKGIRVCLNSSILIRYMPSLISKIKTVLNPYYLSFYSSKKNINLSSNVT